MPIGYLMYPSPVNHFGRFYTHMLVSFTSMDERHDRLRRARIDAGFKSQAEAIRRFDFNRNSYKSNENGNAPFGFEQSKEYGRAFGVRAEWLYDGSGPMKPAPRGSAAPVTRPIPLISWVAAGQMAEPDSQVEAGSATFELSLLPPGNYFATRVDGDSMDKVAPDGSIIVVDTDDREPKDGGRYIFNHDGRTTFKRYDADLNCLMPESFQYHKPIKPSGEQTWEVVGRVKLVVAEI